MADHLSSVSFDIAANRRMRKYSFAEQARRVAWVVGRLFIRLSPRPAFGWRRCVLRAFGAEVGKGVHIYPSTHIYMPWNVSLGDWSALGEHVFIYSLGKVRIGSKVTLSYRSHVCAGTHDLNQRDLPLIKAPVVLSDDVWVGTEAFVGPGITVQPAAVIGARAVVVKDVEPAAIVAGNPARIIGHRNLAAGQR